MFAKLVSFWRAACVPAAAIFLASCTVQNQDVVLDCPEVFVLKQLSEVVRFKPGPGRDLTDVQMEAWIEKVDGGCKLNGSVLTVDLSATFGARRGPSNQSGIADIGYFVAFADSQENILNRESFKAKVPFNNDSSIAFQDGIEVQFTLPRGQDPDSFAVFVGIELNRDELQFNKKRYGG